MKLKYKAMILRASLFIVLFGSLIFTMLPKKQQPDNADILNAQKELEKSKDEQFIKLFTDYYGACISTNMERLKPLVSDIRMIDEDALKKKYYYIEEVRNLECYVVDGLTEDTYVVYVYGELKIREIETPAPSMSVFLVNRAFDDNLIIYLNPVDADVQNYIDKLNDSEAVKNMISRVNENMSGAVDKDDKLKEFISRIS
ncbi:hypothetical protein [Anaerolentibacter hominis]|uniref:hypothetical protein n=1 Tax=Anaerolentibacter hominis TaxID=3079009 RepID=UPI0031B88F78